MKKGWFYIELACKVVFIHLYDPSSKRHTQHQSRVPRTIQIAAPFKIQRLRRPWHRRQL